MGAALIVGAGVGIGGSAARAFAREGYVACVSRRPRHLSALQQLVTEIEEDGGKARAFPGDFRDEDTVDAIVDCIESEVGPIEVLVANVGANVFFSLADTTPRVFRKVWEMATLTGFLAARAVAKRMLERGNGTIIFTGATASVRGGAGFSAFASAKAGLRAVAQSAARELGPKGIHVAHVIVDGAVDGVFARENIADLEQKLQDDAVLRPAHIAQEFVRLHQQPRDAWTHELDVRPWSERF